MKEPNGKGLANRSNPESFTGHSNMTGEALTRAHAPAILSLLPGGGSWANQRPFSNR